MFLVQRPTTDEFEELFLKFDVTSEKLVFWTHTNGLAHGLACSWKILLSDFELGLHYPDFGKCEFLVGYKFEAFLVNLPCSINVFRIHFFPDGVEEEEEEAEEAPVSEAAKARARRVFERALKSMKDRELKEERVSLLNSWLQFERTHGSEEDIEKVQKQMPRTVTKHRKLDDDSFEAYKDYIFPADDQQAANLSKLQQMAAMWKKTGGTITTGE